MRETFTTLRSVWNFILPKPWLHQKTDNQTSKPNTKTTPKQNKEEEEEEKEEEEEEEEEAVLT